MSVPIAEGVAEQTIPTPLQSTTPITFEVPVTTADAFVEASSQPTLIEENHYSGDLTTIDVDAVGTAAGTTINDPVSLPASESTGGDTDFFKKSALGAARDYFTRFLTVMVTGVEGDVNFSYSEVWSHIWWEDGPYAVPSPATTTVDLPLKDFFGSGGRLPVNDFHAKATKVKQNDFMSKANPLKVDDFF